MEILEKVDTQGAYADISLNSALRKSDSLTPLDRAFITELVYGTLRWRGRIDWIISQFSNIPTNKLDPLILNIMRLGVYQLLFLTKVPPFAAVNESAKLADIYGGKGKVGFINANLRAVDRGRDKIEYPDIERDPDFHISVAYSHPLWMVKRWVKTFGLEATINFCQSNNETPPLTIRTNTLKTSRQELFHELEMNVKEVSLTPCSSEGLQIRGASDITAISSFEKGLFQVQDEASQLVAYIIAPKPEERVLDACSAPGGKTTHIAQLMENRGEIFALDINSSRLALLGENCKRLGITNVKAFKKDASLPLGFRGKFHRILVDAPCSGMGALRRNPDSKWKKSEEDIVPLKRLQLSILNNLADYLKEDGLIVYSTCTVTPEENEEVIDDFLSNHSEFALDSISDILPASCCHLVDNRGFFKSYPHLHNMDGFFAARLIKRGIKS
ncbi:MAG: 16S rRNA (cytosine(967)-C(5))-methyltransferase RsmB [Desulfobacterales bacterium]|nr:16S rRNA (cytosine(967)-C(5))-methyltransferase RsmB [Desulfobacterales bacterium]